MRTKDEQYYRAYMKHNEISRRGLLRGLFSGMKKAHQEAARPLVTRTVPRPPRAVEEGLFQSLCDGCGECAKACPEYVIYMQSGLAELNLEYGHCTQCGKCSDTCKTGALSASSWDTGIRPHFSGNCQSYISGSCTSCQIQCSVNAITVSPKQLPKVQPELCYGCGQCKQSCHQNAIDLRLD